MTNETTTPRMHPADLADLKNALRVGARDPVAAPYVATGSDAVLFREVASTLFEEKLRTRGVSDEHEIRSIARSVAREVVTEDLKDIRERVSKFLTGDEIKKIVLSALDDVGLPADDQHKRETRQTIDKVFEAQKRRSLWSAALANEVLKVVAAQCVAGFLAFVAYLSFKGSGGGR